MATEDKENIFASPASPKRHKTKPNKVARTPEECIAILESSPMVEMTRRKPKKHNEGAIPMNLDEDDVTANDLQTPDDATTQEPELNVPYFRKIVADQTSAFVNIITKWTAIHAAETANMSAEVEGEVSSIIGLAQLLMDQRFKHFEELIDDCEFERGDKPTGPSDLQGYWDMVCFQVDNIKRKFAELEKLQAAKWIMEVPEKVIPKAKIPMKKPKVLNKVNVAAKSNFSKFRAQMNKKTEEKQFDGGFFSITSPTKGPKKEPNDESTNDSTVTTQSNSTTETIDATNINETTTDDTTATTAQPAIKADKPTNTYRTTPIAIVTPQRRYLPVVPSPLLQDTTPVASASRPRKSKGRVSLSLPFRELTVDERRVSCGETTPKQRRKSSRTTPLKTVDETNDDSEEERTVNVAVGVTPVVVSRKSYPKTPIPSRRLEIPSIMEETADSAQVEKTPDTTPSLKRSLTEDDTPVQKRRRTNDTVVETRRLSTEGSGGKKRVTRSMARDTKRQSIGAKRPHRSGERRSIRLRRSSTISKK